MNDENKILIVESDPFLIRLLRAKLSHQGFTSFGEEDGAHVFNTAKREKPASIVLEIALPHKDGFEVLGELQRDEETRNIPVFVFTKLGQEEDRKRALALGAKLYRVKMEMSLNEFVEEVVQYSCQIRGGQQD